VGPGTGPARPTGNEPNRNECSVNDPPDHLGIAIASNSREQCVQIVAYKPENKPVSADLQILICALYFHTFRGLGRPHRVFVFRPKTHPALGEHVVPGLRRVSALFYGF
jgi:hypothetical protein